MAGILMSYDSNAPVSPAKAVEIEFADAVKAGNSDSEGVKKSMTMDLEDAIGAKEPFWHGWEISYPLRLS